MLKSWTTDLSFSLAVLTSWRHSEWYNISLSRSLDTLLKDDWKVLSYHQFWHLRPFSNTHTWHPLNVSVTACERLASTSVVLMSTVKMALFRLRTEAGRDWVESPRTRAFKREQEELLHIEQEREPDSKWVQESWSLLVQIFRAANEVKQ